MQMIARDSVYYSCMMSTVNFTVKIKMSLNHTNSLPRQRNMSHRSMNSRLHSNTHFSDF